MACIFFIVIDTCEEKIVLLHERNVTQWSDCSIIIFVCIIYTPLDHILVVTIFAKKVEGYIYPCFYHAFHSVF